MSNYYFPSQPTLIKQSSQILTPLAVHQSNYSLIRSSHTDRTQQEPRNIQPLSSPSPIMQSPQLSREGSFKHILDSTRGQPAMIQARSSGGIDNPRTFSDYQINPSMKM